MVVPAHLGIPGNEKADALARRGAEQGSIDPGVDEPGYSGVRTAMAKAFRAFTADWWSSRQ